MVSAKKKRSIQLPKIHPRRLKKLLDQHFDVVPDRSSQEEVTVVCPVEGCPDRSGNRSINLEKNVTNCWRCGKLGGHVFFLFKSQGIELEESFEELTAEVLQDSPIDIDIDGESDLKGPPADYQVDLPAGFVPLSKEPEGAYAKLISGMARRKNLYLDDFIEAGVGFVRTGMWEPYAVFPIIERGRVVYYQGRTYALSNEKSGNPTKRFPSKKALPFGSRWWIYNYDEAVKPDAEIVIVVESILNVLSLKWELQQRGITGVVPVAVFKHHVSTAQKRKMYASPAKEFCFMYDEDATEEAWLEARGVTGRLATVVQMPKKIDANDNAKLAVDLFLQRKPYSPINELDGLL